MTPKFKSKEYILLNNAMHSLTQWTFITPQLKYLEVNLKGA